MRNSLRIDDEKLNYLVSKVANISRLAKEMVLPFVDFTDLMEHLFRSLDKTGGDPLIVSGHVSPAVAIAADRAHLNVREVLGISPFTGDPETTLKEIRTGKEIVYVANPNRETGANYGLADLEILAEAVPRGTLIIDEHYFDFYGITGLSLLERYHNVVIVRSLTASFGLGSDESGYIVAAQPRIDNLKEIYNWEKITGTHYKIITTCLTSRDAIEMRLKLLHEESLRIAKALNRLKVQNRITATDFMLLRVADPVRVGNFLNRSKIEVRNLDGYPELKHYLRYEIQSELTNDLFISTFGKMPPEFYRMDSLDRRMIHLRKAGHEIET
ncbi:MAG: aminotransferase class I/II-fold pyridoxal phosphate-dependent enzyme, partial [Candidatus Zixiibacteriota bacterium]